MRSLTREWQKATAARDRAALSRMLEQWERIVPTPQEILWASAGKIIRHEAVEGILRPPEVVRVKLLRERWKREASPKFMLRNGQLWNTPGHYRAACQRCHTRWHTLPEALTCLLGNCRVKKETSVHQSWLGSPPNGGLVGLFLRKDE